MNNPFFSIIIPVYNVELYIKQCIESIYNQDIETELFELVIINDGTKDCSIEKIESFTVKYSNITILHQDNKGVSAARNFGIRKARGKYILFVDPDDILIENSLKYLYNELLNDVKDLLIANSYIVRSGFNENKSQIFPFAKKFKEIPFSGCELFKLYNRGSVWGVVYSRTFLIKYNILFNENFKNGEDALFFSLCLIYAVRASYIDIDLYILFERPGSASTTWDENRIVSFASSISEISYLLRSNDYSEDQSAILNSLAFRFYSHLMYRLFQREKGNFQLLQKIKPICVSSGVYPINIEKIPRQRYQIRLLNFSFNIFAFVFFLREKFNRILKKNKK